MLFGRCVIIIIIIIITVEQFISLFIRQQEEKKETRLSFLFLLFSLSFPLGVPSWVLIYFLHIHVIFASLYLRNIFFASFINFTNPIANKSEHIGKKRKHRHLSFACCMVSVLS